MFRNPLLRAIGVAIVLVGSWFMASACGSNSYQVTDYTYLDATGVKDTPYTLLPLDTPKPQGTTIYLMAGPNQAGGGTTAQMVRMSITVDDQRSGARQVVLDYPLSRIEWDQKADTAPSITFTRIQNNRELFTMDRNESLWKRHPSHMIKDQEIDKYDRSPQELINSYTLRAKVTLPPSVYESQVKPILAQPNPAG